MATTKALELGQLGGRATLDSNSTEIEFITSGVDSASIMAIIDSAVGPLIHNTFIFSADSGDAVFTGTDDNGSNLSYDVGNILVQLNGVILVSGEDYTATDGTTITLTEAADSGDDIVVNAFNKGTVAFGQAIEQDFKYDVVGTQGVFRDSDINGNVLNVNALGTIVTINGLTLRPVNDYTITNNEITLTAPADSGDEVLIRSFKTLSLADTVSATNGGTFSGHITAKTVTTTQPFYVHSQTVTEDFTLTTGNNAMAAGPVTINSGVAVSLQSGTRWVVV